MDWTRQLRVLFVFFVVVLPPGICLQTITSGETPKPTDLEAAGETKTFEWEFSYTITPVGFALTGCYPKGTSFTLHYTADLVPKGNDNPPLETSHFERDISVQIGVFTDIAGPYAGVNMLSAKIGKLGGPAEPPGGSIWFDQLFHDLNGNAVYAGTVYLFTFEDFNERGDICISPY